MRPKRKHHWCAHEDGKEAIPNLRRQLLDAGMAHLGVGADRTHANARVINQCFDCAEAFARDFDCMRATRFRARSATIGHRRSVLSHTLLRRSSDSASRSTAPT